MEQRTRTGRALPRGHRPLDTTADPTSKRAGIHRLLREKGGLPALVSQGLSYSEMQEELRRRLGICIGRGSIKYAIDEDPALAGRYARAVEKRETHEATQELRALKDIVAMRPRMDSLEARLRTARQHLIEEDTAAAYTLLYRESFPRAMLPSRTFHRIFKLACKGVYANAIAAKVGLATMTVYNMLSRLDDICARHALPHLRRPRKTQFTERQQTLIERLVPRVGYSAVARRLGVEPWAVTNYAHARGIRSPYKNGRRYR